MVLYSTALSVCSCCLMNLFLSYYYIKFRWLWLVTGYCFIALSFSPSKMFDLLELPCDTNTLPEPSTFLSPVCNPSIYPRYFCSPISCLSLPSLVDILNLSYIFAFLSFFLAKYSGYSCFSSLSILDCYMYTYLILKCGYLEFSS